MERLYRIAGLTVQMDTFGRTEKLAEPYLCEKAPVDLVIRPDHADVQAKNPGISASHCEYLASGASFYQQLMPFALHIGSGFLDVFFQRQGGGVIHDGGIHAQVAFQHFGIAVVLSVIQMDENVHVWERL